MAAIGRRIFKFAQFSNGSVLLFRRFVSNVEEINHCSGIKERINFATEFRGLLIQKELEHLLSLKDVKISKNVQRISINDPHKSQGTDEASLFLYDKIPSLKYNNPDVSIVCTRDESKPWEVKVDLASGDEIGVTTEGKTAEEIFSDLCRVACENST